MKTTDYMPRCAPFDSYLTGKNLIGAEIGVDVGAHAESLLINCDIHTLHLVDVWERELQYGYALGRLETKGWKNKIMFHTSGSMKARDTFPDNHFDFLYFDQLHDSISVSDDLRYWFRKLKEGGIIGYRNYKVETVKKSADEFLERNKQLKHEVLDNEIIIYK